MPQGSMGNAEGAHLPGAFDNNDAVDNQSSTASLNNVQVDSALTQLRSEDQAEILTALLRLREVHIDADVNIPQIVVCGDQSSGKSSVLEAIAGIAFPLGVDTTTRFATEIVLRSSETTPLDYKLIASTERTAVSKNEVERFRMDVHPSGPKDFRRVIEAAGRHLEVLEPNRRFWNDWLRVEMTGPGLPHLTLIDLPGIIQSEDGANALRGDKAKISDLVRSYLQNTRTTVLAVFNGMNDVANQEILTLVRQTGADNRTLGVITRPDIMTEGSDLQKKVIRLARNEKTFLKLGWHVLKNLPHDKSGRSQATRDASEREFLSTGRWNQVNRFDVGIENLRKKLVREQFKRIGDELPQFTSELRQKLRERQNTKSRLGAGRETEREQRAYLSDVLEKLHRLIHTSLLGDYDEVEFLEFFDGDGGKCLRDKVRIETREFSLRMRNYGRQYHIYDIGVHGDKERRNELAELVNMDDLKFFHPYTPSSTGESTTRLTLNVSMQDYCEALAEYMQGNQGTLLPGNWSPKTVRAIFRQQSVPWTKIALEFGDSCYNIAYSFMREAITHIAGQHTGQALMRKFVHAKFEKTRTTFEAKINEILWPFRESHPMTYNPKFEQTKQGIRGIPSANLTSQSASDEDASNLALRSFGDIARENDDFDGDMISAADAMDEAEAYYEIALDNFVDNIAMYAVERCLLSELTKFIPPSIVHDMNDQTLSSVAAECQEDRDERKKTEDEVSALRDAIRIFQRAVRDQEVRSIQDPSLAGPNEQLTATGTNGLESSGQPNDVSTATNVNRSTPPGQSRMSNVAETQRPTTPTTSRIFGNGSITAPNQEFIVSVTPPARPADHQASHRRSPSPFASDRPSSRAATGSIYGRTSSPSLLGNTQAPSTAFRSGTQAR